MVVWSVNIWFKHWSTSKLQRVNVRNVNATDHSANVPLWCWGTWFYYLGKFEGKKRQTTFSTTNMKYRDNRSRAVCNHVQPTAVTLNIPNAKEKKRQTKRLKFLTYAALILHTRWLIFEHFKQIFDLNTHNTSRTLISSDISVSTDITTSHYSSIAQATNNSKIKH